MMNREPEYVSVYSCGMKYVRGMPDNYFNLVLRLFDYYDGDNTSKNPFILIGEAQKAEIAAKLSVIAEDVETMIADLIGGYVLFEYGDGKYRINPWICGRGIDEGTEEFRKQIPSSLIDGRTFAQYLKQKEGEKRENHKRGQKTT